MDKFLLQLVFVDYRKIVLFDFKVYGRTRQLAHVVYFKVLVLIYRSVNLL